MKATSLLFCHRRRELERECVLELMTIMNDAAARRFLRQPTHPPSARRTFFFRMKQPNEEPQTRSAQKQAITQGER